MKMMTTVVVIIMDTVSGYIHTMEYYWAIKIMKYMTTWTNLENTILSEGNQTQKAT